MQSERGAPHQVTRRRGNFRVLDKPDGIAPRGAGCYFLESTAARNRSSDATFRRDRWSLVPRHTEGGSVSGPELVEAILRLAPANPVTSEFGIPYWWQVSRIARLIDKAEREIPHEG
jgi:hypothetical protein